jgi:HEAT repeat protein
LITSTLAIYGKAGLLKDDSFGKIDPLIEWMNKLLSSGDISTEQAKNLSHMSSALASVGNFKVIEPILKFIDANIQPYSHYAVEHLGQIADVNATDALESLLDSTDPELRLKALTVLSRNPSDRALQTIQNYGKRDNLSDTEQTIIQNLSVKEPVIEADPLQALEDDVKEPVVEADLLQILKDDMQSSNLQTRIKALSKLGKEEYGLPILLEALKYDSHSRVRAEAARVIGLSQMRNPDVIPHLIEAMQTDPKRNVREAAIQGLSYNKTSHEQISTAVLARIPEEPVNTHGVILHALTKHPNLQAIPFAMDSITNPKLSARVVRLLKVYVQRGWVTKELIAPAIEWKNSLDDSESLDREQQAAVSEFEAVLATLESSG